MLRNINEIQNFYINMGNVNKKFKLILSILELIHLVHRENLIF